MLPPLAITRVHFTKLEVAPPPFSRDGVEWSAANGALCRRALAQAVDQLLSDWKEGSVALAEVIIPETMEQWPESELGGASETLEADFTGEGLALTRRHHLSEPSELKRKCQLKGS